MAATTLSVVPGLSLGPLHLGASLQEVLTIIKSDKYAFPKIGLYFDAPGPLHNPVLINLPDNGIRLRFDGADQRLRLIEVMDFKRAKLTHKGSELIKANDAASGPAFKRIYQLFGASYPGEYFPPRNGTSKGNYCLSWTGVAFTFPLEHSAWAKSKDHVSLLGSSSASPAMSMALFEGASWSEVQKNLFVTTPSGPRCSALTERPKDHLPAELEMATIQGEGQISFLRRAPAAPFTIAINETTPQDLVTELGAPDTKHKRDTDPPAGKPTARKRADSRPKPNGRTAHPSQPSSYSSTGTDTFDVDFDSGDASEDPADRASREIFWCYFSHGMDILIGPPSSASQTKTPLSTTTRLVVTKVIIHGNIPGSYAFNRHRRLRWSLALPNTEYAGALTSETKFDDLKPSLIHIFQDVWPAAEMGKGKVVNRTWGAASSDSNFFLPDTDEDLVEGGVSEAWLGNTRLYTFPGLVFEVGENGCVSAVTVY